MEFQLFDVVVLTENLPQEKLRRGNMGVIVEILDEKEGIFIVEFVDDEGYTYAEPILKATQLLKTYKQPMLA